MFYFLKAEQVFSFSYLFCFAIFLTSLLRTFTFGLDTLHHLDNKDLWDKSQNTLILASCRAENYPMEMLPIFTCCSRLGAKQRKKKFHAKVHFTKCTGMAGIAVWNFTRKATMPFARPAVKSGRGSTVPRMLDLDLSWLVSFNFYCFWYHSIPLYNNV